MGFLRLQGEYWEAGIERTTESENRVTTLRSKCDWNTQVPDENRCEIPSEMLGDFFSLEGGEQANTVIANDGDPR